MFELTANTVIKNLIIFKVFLEEIFELSLNYWIFGFRVMFLLRSLLNHYFLQR